MHRNRGKYGQNSRSSIGLTAGNMLTNEQKRLVEKQQEMLRSLSFDQNAALSAQALQMASISPLSILPSLGGVLPTADLMSNLLSVSNILPGSSLASTPSMVPPPLMATPVMVPPPNAQLSSGFNYGEHSGNSRYDNSACYNQYSRNYGGRKQNRFFKDPINTNQRGKNKHWGAKGQNRFSKFQDNEDKRSFYSRDREEEENRTRKRYGSSGDESRPFKKMKTFSECNDLSKDSFGKKSNKEHSENKSWESPSTFQKGKDNFFTSQEEDEDYGENVNEHSTTKWESERYKDADSQENTNVKENKWVNKPEFSQVDEQLSDDERDETGTDTKEKSWKIHQKETSDVDCNRTSEERFIRNKSERSEVFGNSTSRENKEQSWGGENISHADQDWSDKSDNNRESWSNVNKSDDVNTWENKEPKQFYDGPDNDHIEDPNHQVTGSDKGNSSLYNRSESTDMIDKPQNKGLGDRKIESNRWNERSRKKQKQSDRSSWLKKSNKDDCNSSVPSNYFYPDSNELKGNNVWSRLDCGAMMANECDNRNSGSFACWNDIRANGNTIPELLSLEDPNLNIRMGLLNNKIGQLNQRMLQLDSIEPLLPHNQLLRPDIWANLANWSSITGSNLASGNDLRHLLQNKAKTGTESINQESDLGGWSENMILIYPFHKITRMSSADISDLSNQLSQRIHKLLLENNEDIQPRFLGTGRVCKNWFMIHCADQSTMNWVLSWNPQLTTKTKMNLCIRKAVDAVRITLISIFLKGVKSNIRDIELRLTTQNEHLDAKLWRRGPHSLSKNGVSVSYLVDAECLKLLAVNSWMVYYEFTKFRASVKEHKPIISLVYV